MKTQNYFFILTIFVVTACQTKRNTIENNNITYDTISVAENYSLLNNPDNPKYELQLSFIYPAACADGEALGKIQPLFLSSFFGDSCKNYTPNEVTTRYVESKLRDYKMLEEEFKKESKNPQKGSLIRFFYHETASNEVIFDKGGLISFSVYVENYTGGAHAAHTLTNRVIDMRRGTFLTEDELFVDGFKDKMAQLLVKNVVAQNKLEDPKQLEELGFFEVDKIVPNGNFLIDDVGVTYSFNEYEIAAYSAGIIHVHVAYAELKDLLRKGNPIAHIVK
jgi:hypothetical protein